MSSLSALSSYFPFVVRDTRFNNDAVSGVSLRESDFYILQRQNPVGWSFFSKTNVDYLLRKVQQTIPEADFDTIVDDMIKVFNVNAAQERYEMSDQTTVTAQLNEIVLDAVERRRIQTASEIYRANKLLAQPNMTAAFGMLPKSDRVDRVLYIDRRNVLL